LPHWYAQASGLGGPSRFPHTATHIQTLSSASAGRDCMCAYTPCLSVYAFAWTLSLFPLLSPPSRPLLLVLLQVFPTRELYTHCVACLMHARDRQLSSAQLSALRYAQSSAVGLSPSAQMGYTASIPAAHHSPWSLICCCCCCLLSLPTQIAVY